MQHYTFATYRRPHCIWDVDLAERNIRFLRGLDPGYFQYLGELFSERLRSGTDTRAAVALRAAYFHGLESFFALVGALLQAPEAVPAWLLRYKPGELVDLVRAIDTGSLDYVRVRLPQVSWGAISGIIHGGAGESELRPTIIEGFAHTWTRFASDFVNPDLRAEYNSIKHGLRISPGGFTLAFQREASLGVADPEAPWHSLGGSAHGMEYSKVEEIGNTCNFRLRREHRNWMPGNLASGLFMISASTRNVISTLLVGNGADREGLELWTPPDVSMYNAPWRESEGVLRASFDRLIPPESIQPLTPSAIRELLAAQKPSRRSPRGSGHKRETEEKAP